MHTDSIINELNEAVDISSSKKTIAYKYFKGNLVDLEKYLDQNLNPIPIFHCLFHQGSLNYFLNS